MANLSFNANEVEPRAAYTPIPAGKYLAMITASEEKSNKTGEGRYLEFTFQILEGPFQNHKVWVRLNLTHSNSKAVQIARAELSAICRAVGVMTPRDSVELHNLPLVITVKCKPRKDNGEITNVISDYAKREAAAGQPQQAATSTPPWRRQ
jgi:hypothetical protein